MTAPTTSRPIYSELAERLLALEPRAFFGLMGEDTALLTAALSEAGVPYIAARHEAAVIGMADGFASASGELGIALVTRGPGLINALTAARTAVRARRRVLIITGEAPTKRWYLPDPKAVDQRMAATAVGLEYHSAPVPEEVGGAFARALRAAQAGRPAVLAIVTNVLNGPSTADFDETLPGATGAALAGPVAALRRASPLDAAAVARAAAALADSRRPLVLAGRGALHAKAELEALAERAGALLGTTLPAKDLFLGDPYDLGVVGGFATDPAAALLRDVDCVAVFGACLSDFTTAERTLLREAMMIHVDVAPERIGAYYPVEIGITGDAAATARALLAALPPRPGGTLRSAETQARLRRPLYEGPDETSDAGIDPRIVATTLDTLLPEQRTIVIDTGRFSGAPSRYMRTSGPGTFRFTGDFGAIGSALGPALGAAVARPDHTTVLFVGDGGLMLSLADLDTAARHGIPLVVVVMNDHAFGAERHVLAAADVDQRHAEFPDTDFATLAVALGFPAATVRTADDIRARADALRGPLLLDCKLRPDLPPPRVKEAGPPKTAPHPVP